MFIDIHLKVIQTIEVRDAKHKTVIITQFQVSLIKGFSDIVSFTLNLSISMRNIFRVALGMFIGEVRS